MHVTAASARSSPNSKTTKAVKWLMSSISSSTADAIKMIVAKNIDGRKDEPYDC